MLLYIGVCGQKFNAIVARVGMWVTMRATESERKGLVRGLGKGWQTVGKMFFSFPRAVNALSMLLSMPSSDGVQGYPYIHA